MTVTALIQSVLGEIEKTSGKILVEGKVSFTAQNPFVFSGTVRENVLFGEEMDGERYERTLEVTCLQPDIQSFETGDITIIGDRGVSLRPKSKDQVWPQYFVVALSLKISWILVEEKIYTTVN